MLQQPEMEAEALVTIISKIQRARRTGLLLVKRVNGGILEEGAITFVKGQVTGSETGHRRGQDAFNLMSQWKGCRFSFVSANPQDDALLLSSSPPPPSPPPPIVPISPLRKLSSFSPVPEEFSPIKHDHLQSIPTSAIIIPNILFEAALPVIDQMGSRMYRQVFLLIDGQRSAAEIIRLIGRAPGEVDKILRNLEHAGIIRIVIPQE